MLLLFLLLFPLLFLLLLLTGLFLLPWSTVVVRSNNIRCADGRCAPPRLL